MHLVGWYRNHFTNWFLREITSVLDLLRSLIAFLQEIYSKL